MASEKPGKQSSPDPLQLWRDWLDQSERQWNAALNELMGSEPFSQASGKMMEALLGLQTSMNQASQRYFSAINLPTRTDLLALAERLSGIEARLGEIEAALHTLAGPARSGAPAPPKPKRTKKAATRTAPRTASPP